MPATSSTVSSSSSASGSSTKIQSSHKTSGSKQIKQKRNERERKRVDQVNQGFTLLQERVPRMAGKKTKLSKVETLREAVRYIVELQTMLGQANTSMPLGMQTPDQSPVYPQSLCSMAPTPSPNYISPYYPAPHMMTAEPIQEIPKYYTEVSTVSSTSEFYPNGTY